MQSIHSLLNFQAFLKGNQFPKTQIRHIIQVTKLLLNEFSKRIDLILPDNIEIQPTELQSVGSMLYDFTNNKLFLDNIRQASGYEAASERSSEFSFEDNQRNQIFKKRADNVQDLNSLKDLMLLNPNASSDEEFEREALAQRFDLYSQPIYSGMIDTKCSNIQMAQNQVCHAINGPSHVNHKPFSFKNAPNIPQQGMPQTYNFDWITMDLSNH